MIRNLNTNNNLEYSIYFSIFHFWALSEINGILFALLEELKKSAHIIFKNDKEYNKDKNFYKFFLDLVLYDSSQINFNYLSSILSNMIINLINVTPTYIVSFLFNTLFFILLYFFHISELTEEHDNEIIYACKIGSFFFFYLFTGIIGLLPFYLIENKNNPKNIIIGNFCLFLGVIIKNCFHILFKSIIKSELAIYWVKGLLFLLCSIPYIVFLSKKNPKKNDVLEYSKGKLTIKQKFSSITFQFQKSKEYFKIFFSTPSVLYLLIFNLTSRTQKIMFKSKFKEEFDENWLMPLTFFLSFVIYLIIMCCYFFCRKKKEIEIEKEIELKKTGFFEKVEEEEEIEENSEEKINIISTVISDINNKEKVEKNEDENKMENIKNKKLRISIEEKIPKS